MGPSAQQIDLFRAVVDVHEITGAIVVLLTDRDGIALAAAGDENEFPVLAVGEEHVLTIAFDVEASLETVQLVGREAPQMIAEILRPETKPS